MKRNETTGIAKILKAELTGSAAFRRAPQYDRADQHAEAYLISSVCGTEVFAYFGSPDGLPPDGKAPAVVLVHGGGGTAFPDWVREWNKRGFAAVSVDTEGHIPSAGACMTGANVVKESLCNAPENSHMEDGELPVREQWMFHAIAAVISARNFLKAMPCVDGNRIGLTGISYGGVIVSDIAAYDNGFAFIVPVYGCLSLRGTSGIFGEIYARNPRSADLWDGSEFAHGVSTPMLFINGNTDPYFTVDATDRSCRSFANARMYIVNGLCHGQSDGCMFDAVEKFAHDVFNAAPHCPPSVRREGVAFTVSADRECDLTAYCTPSDLLNAHEWQAVKVGGGSFVPPSDTFAFYVNSHFSDGTELSSCLQYVRTGEKA